MADDPRISQGIVIYSRSVELAAAPVGCRVEHAVPRRSPACAGCGRPECRGRLDGRICWTDRRQEQLARRWAPSRQIPPAQLLTQQRVLTQRLQLRPRCAAGSAVLVRRALGRQLRDRRRRHAARPDPLPDRDGAASKPLGRRARTEAAGQPRRRRSAAGVGERNRQHDPPPPVLPRVTVITDGLVQTGLSRPIFQVPHDSQHHFWLSIKMHCPGPGWRGHFQQHRTDTTRSDKARRPGFGDVGLRVRLWGHPSVGCHPPRAFCCTSFWLGGRCIHA